MARIKITILFLDRIFNDNKLSNCPLSLPHRINYKFLRLSAYWRSNLANERGRICAVIVKREIYLILTLLISSHRPPYLVLSFGFRNVSTVFLIFSISFLTCRMLSSMSKNKNSRVKIIYPLIMEIYFSFFIFFFFFLSSSRFK